MLRIKLDTTTLGDLAAELEVPLKEIDHPILESAKALSLVTPMGSRGKVEFYSTIPSKGVQPRV